MGSKRFVAIVAVLLAIFSLHELSYTWYANKVRNKATKLSLGDKLKESEILDSLSISDSLNLGIVKYNYPNASGKEMKLGLDLKGGINVVLELSVKDLLVDLTDYSSNPYFLELLRKVDEKQKSSNKDYIDNFFSIHKEDDSAGKLALSSSDIFGNSKLSSELNFNSSDQEVEKVIRQKVEASIATAYEVIRARIDRFGVASPNVQRIENSGRILVELPGVKDTERVQKLLQSSARLEFWEVFTIQEVSPYFNKLALKIKSEDFDFGKSFKLSGFNGSNVGAFALSDTAKVGALLRSPEAIKLRPSKLKYAFFFWGAKANEDNTLDLYAIKGNRKRKAPLDGNEVSNASKSFDQLGRVQIDMQMNANGASVWKNLTEKSIGKPIAIVLDKLVYTAPYVNSVIPNGRSQISGNFSIQEASDLVNVLGAGQLPASAKIVQSEVVGPSLGKESVKNGLYSFGIALIIVLAWMIFYYALGGVFSNIALVANLLFIFGVLASLKATLTLPGIAGIVLTIGVSVDANVLIYERIKEELFAGKNIKQAVKEGFDNALSSILDANVTTFLTALILFVFGKGPVKGFATTLMIGIFTSLFCAILLSRYFIERRLEKGKDVSFFTNTTKGWLQNINLNFIEKSKKTMIASLVLLVISLGALFGKGLNLGIDFKGGRTYVVKFDKEADVQQITENLTPLFEGEKPSVKLFGGNDQVKITTKYKVDDESVEVDQQIVQNLYKGVKSFLPTTLTPSNFIAKTDDQKFGVMSSLKVGPSIADDITYGAFIAVILSLLVVFVYILARFRKWQFSFGAVAAVFHDVIIVLGMFALLDGILPFSLEVDQAFIAAILTVIGYSLNDTVVVFDRIREFLEKHPKMSLGELINKSISSTMSRTLNTSVTTLFVILVIFLFGGEAIQGFMFALLVGIIVGTYSSVFIASPVMYYALKNKLKTRTK